MSSDYQKYKTTITAGADAVFVSLPDDAYIQLTPEKARQLGTALFRKAAEAEGKPSPEVIWLASS